VQRKREEIKRFFVNQALGKDFILQGIEHNHLANVLRLQVGEEIVVCNGDEFDYVFEISNITKQGTTLIFLSKVINDKNPKSNVTVFLATIKHESLSLAVEKLNEIGATEIVLFNSARCNVPIKSVKLDKLKTIAEQSCKQCERSMPVKIRVGKLSDLDKFDFVVFADETQNRKILCSLSDIPHNVKNVAIVIGPEGGFTNAERDALCAMPSVRAVSLGSRILRAETAAIAATTLVMARLGEM